MSDGSSGFGVLNLCCFLAPFAFVLASAIWVYCDAKAIGVKKGMLKGFCNLSYTEWAVVVAMLWIIGFPAYLAYRTKLKRIAAPPPVTLPPRQVSAGDPRGDATAR